MPILFNKFNNTLSEGQSVKKGDLLAQIDPRTYQAQLDQTQATLEHDQAHLKNAQTNLQRYRARPYLENGQLISCLEPWCAPEDWLYLYYPMRKHLSAGLRAVIETLRS